MHCPENLAFKASALRYRLCLHVWMYWRDVPRHTIPLRIWMNPLRYEIWLRVFERRITINREGAWAWRLPNALRRLRTRTEGARE